MSYRGENTFKKRDKTRAFLQIYLFQLKMFETFFENSHDNNWYKKK